MALDINTNITNMSETTGLIGIEETVTIPVPGTEIVIGTVFGAIMIAATISIFKNWNRRNKRGNKIEYGFDYEGIKAGRATIAAAAARAPGGAIPIIRIRVTVTDTERNSDCLDHVSLDISGRAMGVVMTRGITYHTDRSYNKHITYYYNVRDGIFDIPECFYLAFDGYRNYWSFRQSSPYTIEHYTVLAPWVLKDLVQVPGARDWVVMVLPDRRASWEFYFLKNSNWR